MNAKDHEAALELIRATALNMITVCDRHVAHVSAQLRKCIDGAADAPRAPAPSPHNWLMWKDDLEKLVAAMPSSDRDLIVTVSRHFLVVMREPIPGYRPDNAKEKLVAEKQIARRRVAWKDLATLVGAPPRDRC